jgi:16S rRNA (cytosine967-C5)-methyltransferase
MKPSPKTRPPIAKGLESRHLAHALLMRVFKQKQTVEQAMLIFPQELQALSGSDRGFVLHLVMGVLRHHGDCAAILALHLREPLRETRLDITLCFYLGICQIFLLKTPPHAAVDTTVELAKSLYPPLAGLVNAVLKKIAHTGESLWDNLPANQNTPEWLWQLWGADYGVETATQIATAHRHEPPLDVTLRDNASSEEWSTRLGAMVLPTGSLRLHASSGGEIPRLAGFAEGAWWVQEIAASLPVKVMGNLQGKQVLDCCAAPGGKTLQLIAAGATVTAVDISAQRLKRLQENLTRMNVSAEIQTADIQKWQPEALYDAILLDAPCSATGTIRRHPELMLLRQPEDVARLVAIQQKMLRRALHWLKPEGILVYAVCSLQAAEGEQQIAVVVAENLAEIIPITADELDGMTQWLTPQGTVRTLPHYLAERGGMDGFFVAKLRVCKVA